MRNIALLLSFLLLFSVSGCAPRNITETNPESQITEYENMHETPQKGGTLRLAMAGADNLNPILTKSQNNLYVLKLLYDGLFQVLPNQQVEPVLCETYSVSENGLQYTFLLKSGISFHNGAPLTARDAEQTLSLLLASDGFYRERFSVVDSVSSEGMKLFVRLNQPVINFPALLDFPILSAGDLGTPAQATASARDYVPNGTGRYKIQSYKKSKELYFSVNQNYFREFSPYIADIRVFLLTDDETAISMLENMQIDLLPTCLLDLSAYTPKRSLSVTNFSDGDFTFLGINNQRPAFLTPLTRGALAAAISKGKLLETSVVPYVEAAELPLPAGSFWSNQLQEEKAENPEAVHSMLIQDGWQDSDDDGILDKLVYDEQIDASFTILVNQENAGRQKIAESIKNQLTEAGVPARVESLSFAEYQERIYTGVYDLFVGSVSFSANYDLSFLLRTDENPCGISLERVDHTLWVMESCVDEGQLQSLYYDLCDTVRREMPFVPLYFEQEMILFDNRIKGNITPATTDIFYGIENWFISKE